MKRKHILRSIFAVFVCAVTAALLFGQIEQAIWGNEGKQLTTLSPQGQAADTIQKLVTPVFLIAFVILIGVVGAVMFISFKFRDTGEDEDEVPAQLHGNTVLEVGWTILPALILLVVAVLTVGTIRELEKREPDALRVKVMGQQWWWAYQYDLNNDGNYTGPEDVTTATELVIPTGREVDLVETSNDVIHSFWIPAINGKLDAVPGRTHTLIMTADKPGIYQGQCTEYCGLSHGVMRMELKALPPAEFDKWVDAMTSVPDQPTDPKAIAGQELFVSQCARCHQVDGLTPESSPPFKYSKLPDPEYGQTVDSTLTSKNAPNLTHLMMRQTFAGSLLPLYQGKAAESVTAVPDGVPDRSNLKDWLRDPESVKPMNPENNQGMPNLQLSETQIDQLVAYLVTLK